MQQIEKKKKFVLVNKNKSSLFHTIPLTLLWTFNLGRKAVVNVN